MELTLRHNPMLDDADCEAILAIHTAVGWDRRMPPAELRTLYQHSGYSLLAERDGRLVGLLRAEEETPIRVWLAEIAVLPGAQSSGVGAALLRRFAEDHRGAYLFTDATLGTEAFFRRHGIHIQQVLEKTLRDQSGT
ncbi:TPA: GNAT family N-acetyltransferase [Pseudomonas aeruginosa]|nr:GNAT family N-acetyltransferase [Pseudomonas aeruginosa]HCW0492657.1 GNAT family N-acetyltransferase [Pseudomonas aeruginosa]HCW0523267.1 GNAT family N-acetyltransferase [Pseudomonas aeruginosa]HCW0595887.1 GNAT family N-acetyltransferase [Pseudomonas aeruginosa]